MKKLIPEVSSINYLNLEYVCTNCPIQVLCIFSQSTLRTDWTTLEIDKNNYISFSKAFNRNILIRIDRLSTGSTQEAITEIALDYLLDVNPNNAQDVMERVLKLKAFL